MRSLLTVLLFVLFGVYFYRQHGKSRIVRLLKWLLYGIWFTCGFSVGEGPLNMDDLGYVLSSIVIWLFVRIFLYVVLKQEPSKGGKRNGLQFEQDCASYLRKHGYLNVRVTPASGDFGADITASDWRGNRYVFQCKYYLAKVGNSCVQEVIGAKAHYHANKAGVMTNSKLTDKARQLAWENDVILMEEILE